MKANWNAHKWEQFKTLANKLYKNRATEGNYIEIPVSFIKQLAEKYNISFDEMVDLISNQLK